MIMIMRLMPACAVCALFFLLEVQLVHADIDAALAQYLKSVSEFNTLRFSASDFADTSNVVPGPHRKRLGDLYLLKSFEAIVDFKQQSYKISESIYPDGSDKAINRVRAWHDNMSYEYIADDSPGLGKGETAGNGIVSKMKLNPRDLPDGPRRALGFGITEAVGQSIDLADLILSGSIESLSENRYGLKNVFRWDASFGAAYDLEFTLDPQHGYLLSKYAILERRFQGPEIVQPTIQVAIHKFTQLSGLWLPVDITSSRFRGGQVNSVHRVVVDCESASLNVSVSAKDFEIVFPPGKTYLDARTLTLHEPNRPPLDVSGLYEEPETSLPIESDGQDTYEYASTNRPYYMALVLIFCVSAMASVVMLLRRGLAHRVGLSLLLCIVPGVSGLGCRQSQAQPEFVRLFPVDSGLDIAILGGNNRMVRRSIGSSDTKDVVVFELVNRGSRAVEFNETLKASCGCTNASLDKAVVGPGERFRITAFLTGAELPTSRTVSLELAAQTPKTCSASVYIQVECFGDWYLKSSDVELTGVLGSLATGSVEIAGNPQSLDTLSWTAEGVEVLAADRVSRDKLIIDLRSKIDSLYVKKVSGKLRLHAQVGKPKKMELTVCQTAKPIANWAPKALVLDGAQPSSSCQINLMQGAVLRSIEAESFEIDWQPTDDGPVAVALALRDHSELDGDVKFVTAVVALNDYEQEVKLPVVLRQAHEGRIE